VDGLGCPGGIDIILEPAHELVHRGREVDEVVKSGGGISAYLLLDQLGQGGDRVIEIYQIGQIPGREVEPVVYGPKPGDDGGETWACGYGGGMEVPEQHPLLGQSVEVGTCVTKIPITAQMVRSEGVNGYEDAVYSFFHVVSPLAVRARHSQDRPTLAPSAYLYKGTV